MCVRNALQVVLLANTLYLLKEAVSMGWNGLERNKLDFILSDLLPVELSELFSYSSFYSFLLTKGPQKRLDSMVELLKVKMAYILLLS